VVAEFQKRSRGDAFTILIGDSAIPVKEASAVKSKTKVKARLKGTRAVVSASHSCYQVVHFTQQVAKMVKIDK